jgi:hypothetical protein
MMLLKQQRRRAVIILLGCLLVLGGSIALLVTIFQADQRQCPQQVAFEETISTLESCMTSLPDLEGVYTALNRWGRVRDRADVQESAMLPASTTAVVDQIGLLVTLLSAVVQPS